MVSRAAAPAIPREKHDYKFLFIGALEETEKVWAKVTQVNQLEI